MVGIVILAAGASTRMGQPKQQLLYENQTLLQHSVNAAVESVASAVVVVLGANATAIRPAIEGKEVLIGINNDWQQGMGSSIRCGLQHLLSLHPAVENALFMLCDQPFVNTALLNQLIQTQQETQAGIVACSYQGTEGAPVLFNRSYFNELLALSGQEGAKKVLIKYSDKVIAVPFNKGAVDIDTPDDYKQLINNEKTKA